MERLQILLTRSAARSSWASVVGARQGQRQALRQLQLEVMPALVADGAAETDHGRFRHLRILGQRRQVLGQASCGLARMVAATFFSDLERELMWVRMESSSMDMMVTW
jgi:hypothetical protein